MSSPLKRSKLLRVGLAVALAGGAVAVPAVALACSAPTPVPDFSIAERTRMADVVLVGQVLTTTESAPEDKFAASVRVSETIKGGPLDDVVQIADFGNPALCLNYTRPGQGWLFFAAYTPSGDLRLRYFSIQDAIEPPSAANIAAARSAALGTPDPPSSTPTATATATPAPSPTYRLWIPFLSAPALARLEQLAADHYGVEGS